VLARSPININIAAYLMKRFQAGDAGIYPLAGDEPT
jgi:hypothetical protein